MNCPFCGKEMREGAVLCPTDRNLYSHDLQWWDDIEAARSKLKRLNDTPKELHADEYSYLSPLLKAHCCQDCQKVILDTYIVE